MEGTNCSERALLPEKSMREKLSQLIEDDFSKVTLVNTLKYFKQKSGKNECVDATIKILEHIKKENEVPKLYKTLLREIRKDSPISSWLPRYSQRDTKLLLSILKQDCDIFGGDFKKPWMENQINQICKKLQLKSKIRINKCVDSGTISII